MALHKEPTARNNPTPADAHYARDLSPPGSPQTALGANLRASVVDPVHDKIMGHSFVRGGPKVADENIDGQTRDVPDDLGPVVYGAKRQTTPSKVGDVVAGTLPATSGASAANPVRKSGS